MRYNVEPIRSNRTRDEQPRDNSRTHRAKAQAKTRRQQRALKSARQGR